MRNKGVEGKASRDRTMKNLSLVEPLLATVVFALVVAILYPVFS